MYILNVVHLYVYCYSATAQQGLGNQARAGGTKKAVTLDDTHLI